MTTAPCEPIDQERQVELAHSLARMLRAPGEHGAELMGEIWIAIHLAVDGYDPACGARFETYAAVAARRRIRDRYRRPLRQWIGTWRAPVRPTTFSAIDPDSTEFGFLARPDPDRDNWDVISALRDAVENLPDGYRDLVQMRYGLGRDEMTCREIGDLSGVTRQVIESRLATAIRMLARTLRERGIVEYQP